MFFIQQGVVFLMLMASALVSFAQGRQESLPFADKPLAMPQIHVESPSLFRVWRGGEVPDGNYAPEYFDRRRWGTISLSANVQAHIDAIRDKVHFPSYFELIHARTGTVLGVFPVITVEDAEWYFNGSGVAYLNQRNLSLCGPRYTRKFSVTAKALVEVPQPLLYIGEETQVMDTTPLFESPTSKNIVATLLVGTKATVIGLRPGPSNDPSNHAIPPLLVKTPFGLTGWHRADGMGNGALQLYQCN